MQVTLSDRRWHRAYAAEVVTKAMPWSAVCARNELERGPRPERWRRQRRQRERWQGHISDCRKSNGGRRRHSGGWGNVSSGARGNGAGGIYCMCRYGAAAGAVA
jgi:hypothetical protein